MKKICVYHANCADGFTSAWIVHNSPRGFEYDFFPASYTDAPEKLESLLKLAENNSLLFVDFSYSRETMLKISSVADDILILDHHKTAKEALESLFEEDNIDGIFDMERSGAGITWDYIYPDLPRPLLVETVEDRDLWNFKHPYTRIIQDVIFSYEYTFGNWDILNNTLLEEFQAEGEALSRKHFKDIREIGETGLTLIRLRKEDPPVPCVNANYHYASDLASNLCKKEKSPYAVSYYIDKRGLAVLSLRSIKGADNEADVSIIAKEYGGGGHPNASGCSIPVKELFEQYIYRKR